MKKHSYSTPLAALLSLPKEDVCLTSGGNGSTPSVAISFSDYFDDGDVDMGAGTNI